MVAFSSERHIGPHTHVSDHLLQTPPEPVRQRLASTGLNGTPLVLCTPTDIDRQGAYRRQWLAATKDKVWVVPEDPHDAELIHFELREASEMRTVAGIGSGTLAAKVHGTYFDILRYSNRQAYRFERVAPKLEQLRKGEEVEITFEDEHDPRRCAKCGIMLDQPGASCAHCVRHGYVITRMLKLMKPYRKQAITMMGLLLVGVALDLVSPQLTRYLVDRVLPQSAGGQLNGAQVSNAMTLLLSVVVVLGIVQVARTVVNVFNGRLGSRVGTAVTSDMRSRLVDHLQKLSVSFYDKQQVGSLMGRVAYDTESLQGFLSQLTGGFLLQLLMVVGVAIMMFSLDATLALYALLPAPLVMGGTVVFWKYVYPRYYVSWDASSKQAGALSGMLSGIRVVKAFNQEQRELDRFNKVSGRLRHAKNHVDMSISTFNPIIGLVFQMGGWIVWYFGGRQVLEGTMSLGELMAFFGYLWMFYGPLAALPQFTNWLTSFVTQANRIFEILDAPVAGGQPKDAVRVGEIKGAIELQNASFGYARHTPVLRDINLKIEPGEMVGIVGGSGSGKSTLINLICRFYDPDEGRVLVDGVDVRALDQNDLRSQVGVVLQEPFLFRGSISDNLTYGRPSAEPELVLSAAKSANCHDFIMRQPHAYDTWLGERGAGLSGGERQRVSIARALLTDPRILILDEATASVDAESEALIQAALNEVVKGRTTIAIAHRLSTLRRADRIVVMERGQIAEVGSHEDLVAQGGRYSKLLKLQGHAAPRAQGTDRVLDDSPRMVATACVDDFDPDFESLPDSPLPPMGGHQVRWLEPEFAQIHLGNWNTLHVTIRNERIYGGVFALRCMPIHFPAHFISLRHLDSQGREQEIGVIKYLGRWPEEAQHLVREALRRRYLVHTVLGIESIEQKGSFLNIDAQTDLGPVLFAIRAQPDRAQEFGARGKMLLDTDDNRYFIPDLEALPARDQKLFKRYIYW